MTRLCLHCNILLYISLRASHQTGLFKLCVHPVSAPKTQLCLGSPEVITLLKKKSDGSPVSWSDKLGTKQKVKQTYLEENTKEKNEW